MGPSARPATTLARFPKHLQAYKPCYITLILNCNGCSINNVRGRLTQRRCQYKKEVIARTVETFPLPYTCCPDSRVERLNRGSSHAAVPCSCGMQLCESLVRPECN
jgi:hypothetical protein